MTISLKNNLFELWKTNYLRRGIQSEFKPSFIRYIGVEKQEEYNSVLKTLVSKSEEDKEYTIPFYFDSYPNSSVCNSFAYKSSSS